MNDRRRHRRVTFQVPATLVLGVERAVHRATLMDLAEGGMFLLMSETVAVGKTTTVRWRIDAQTPCEATGWVQRVMPFPHGQGIAIEFGVANPGLLHFLHNLVAAAEPDRANLLADIEDLVVQIV